jgi:phosphoribosylcarboxyaminoimidazole (NCAIR) mutase
VQILATADPSLREKFAAFKQQLVEKIAAKDAKLNEELKRGP